MISMTTECSAQPSARVWAKTLRVTGLGWVALLALTSPINPVYAEDSVKSVAKSAALTTAAVDVPSGAYGLDKTHGYVTFSYSHLGFSNPEVGFNEFDVDLQLDAQNLQNSTFTVQIEAASIDSRVAEFDKHLKGTDYFDVTAHPLITFASTGMAMTSATTADITGVLTIKGIAKPITLAAVLNKAGIHPLQRVPAVGVSASAQIKRSEWGLSKYVPMVGDDVTLRIEVELPKASTAAE